MTFGNVLIFGDSYSTFKDAVPDGYAVYYTTKREIGPNITDISDTWWYPLMKETDSNLVRNDSWSGSTICYTGYNGTDTSKTNCFIFRLRKLAESGFFRENRIDTVFIFGATNDNWADAPLGENKYSNIDESDLYCVLPAISYFIGELKSTLPEARIIFIINSELKSEITLGIKNAAEHYGIDSILLKDIEKGAGHPTVLGMRQIKEQILRKI